jgi:Family of unknown function (DUF6476)
MRSLKLVVIVLGILIVAAFATVIVTLVVRAGSAAGDKPWARALDVPAGATIRDYRLDGDRLVIRLAVPGKPDELRVFDLSRGRPTGAITLKPQ